jgi:hypothetical protein
MAVSKLIGMHSETETRCTQRSLRNHTGAEAQKIPDADLQPRDEFVWIRVDTLVPSDGTQFSKLSSLGYRTTFSDCSGLNTFWAIALVTPFKGSVQGVRVLDRSKTLSLDHLTLDRSKNHDPLIGSFHRSRTLTP